MFLASSVWPCCLQPVGMTTATGLEVSARAVKGVDSCGMLCSAADIGWTQQADGVLVVMPADSRVGDPAPSEPPAVRGVQGVRLTIPHLLGLNCKPVTASGLNCKPVTASADMSSPTMSCLPACMRVPAPRQA